MTRLLAATPVNYLHQEAAAVQAHEEEDEDVAELVGPPEPLEHLLSGVVRRERVPAYVVHEVFKGRKQLKVSLKLLYLIYRKTDKKLTFHNTVSFKLCIQSFKISSKFLNVFI